MRDVLSCLVPSARPIFSSFPKDEIVSVGLNVSFSCAARGAPQPSIFWTREGSQELMFPGNEYQGRYKITEDGSLRIKSVLGKDEGHYVCSAISQAGASTATVFLQVLDRVSDQMDDPRFFLSDVAREIANRTRIRTKGSCCTWLNSYISPLGYLGRGGSAACHRNWSNESNVASEK